MTGRKTQLLLGGILGLSMALACNSAVGAIIFVAPFSSLGGEQGDFLQSLAGEFLDPIGGVGGDAGMTPAAPRPAFPPEDRQNPPIVHLLEGLVSTGASAGQPSTASQGGGNGPTNAAMAVALSDLPQTTLQTRLPRDPTIILTTGPPFELLRPA